MTLLDVTQFMSLLKFSKNAQKVLVFDANNDLQEDLKIFKCDTFEINKSFVPAEVQSLTEISIHR